jgi:SAM-dependent methyltransferase
MWFGKLRRLASGRRDGQEFWERHAQRDPLWAILSDPVKKGRKWDLPEFFETGTREIAVLLYRLAELEIPISLGTALDFGCGVGRLTQALAAHFDQAVGVDISPTMIALAEKLNTHANRVRYVANSRDDLSVFDADSFDFIYSAIVLQHVQPATTRRYLADFFRILKKGGVLVFQLPSHARPARDRRPSATAMPDDAYRAQVTVQALPQTVLAPSSEIRAVGSVKNISSRSWSRLEHGSIGLGNHWLDGRGEMMLVQDDGRVSLPPTLGPGEAFDFALKMQAPRIPGAYQCEIDLVHEAVCWFADRGSNSARFAVRVGQQPDDATGRGDERRPAAFASAGVARRDIYDDLPAQTEEPGTIPMYCIERNDVASLVSAHGAQLIQVDEDTQCGMEWVGYRYFVRK